LPSPFRSATAIAAGLATKKFCAAWNVPLPLPSRIDTLFEAMFATATSSVPSPFKSAAAA
jgi:hypothetical protein